MRWDDLDTWRFHWARLVRRVGELHDAGALTDDDLTEAERRMSTWPGWVRRAPLTWSAVTRPVTTTHFDYNEQEEYQRTQLHFERWLPPHPGWRLARVLALAQEVVMTEEQTATLAAQALLSRLEGLTVDSRWIDAGALRSVCQAAPELTFLSVSGQQMVEAVSGLYAMAVADASPGLRALSLCGFALDSLGAEALAAASFMPALDELDLAANRVGDGGALALGRVLQAPRRLDLARNQIGPVGIAALAPKLRHADRLSLRDNPLGDAGVATLAEQGGLESVQDLWLGGVELTDVGLDAILAADPPCLTDLDLTHNQLTDDGVRRLVASPLMSRLVGLVLFHNRLGLGAEKALHGHPLAFSLRQSGRLDGRYTVNVSRWPTGLPNAGR